MATESGSATADKKGAHSERALLNEHATATWLSVSVKTLRRWRWARRGPPFVKIGACVRYEVSALSEFIAANRQLPVPDTANERSEVQSPLPQSIGAPDLARIRRIS
jgi:hypothetical protein